MIETSAEPIGRPIHEIAEKLGLEQAHLLPYGRGKAKIDLALLDGPRPEARVRAGPGKLILISAITPTPAGEGKTTTAIGLTQALDRLGQSAVVALRQPSLGPCFGKKGGGTGGGLSRLIPTAAINLHLTGDFHAVTSAHNLLAALIDNRLHFGGRAPDPRHVTWPRVLDMNDRALRRIVTGLGGPANGVPRETGFEITAASEVMAILCLASGHADLRQRLDRIVVGFDAAGDAVTARDLDAGGAMHALLAEALEPNLVQTIEGTPAIVHGGPFANIAHGASSVLGTRVAMHLADWTITEAGFGFDLGAEKFFDIKCRIANLDPAAVVLVATVRALKYHGGLPLDRLAERDPASVEAGLPNLARHVESIQCFGERPIVALNLFGGEEESEVEVIRAWCARNDVVFATARPYDRGGEGTIELARLVMATAEKQSSPFRPLYPLEAPVVEKVLTIARRMYGAESVRYSEAAERDLAAVERLRLGHLPVCIAKTPASLSANPERRGRPTGFEIPVERVHIAAGAGFLVVIAGDILRMPGLPRAPRAEEIDWQEGRIRGVG